jgi:phosphoserine phosphatase RsbU/P
MSAHAPLTVLLVDRDGPESAGLADALGRAGYVVRRARTGGDGLHQARERPALVLLAVHLPDMSGFEVCRLLKSDPATASCLVLLLSCAGGAERAAALEGGADGYLLRPVHPRELLAQVRALLRLRRAEEALRDSEALYHSLVENLPVFLIRKDRQGRFTFANRPFCNELKVAPEGLLGKTDFDFYAPELAAKYVADDRRVMETGEPFQGVERHQPPGGERTYVEVLKAPVRDARGRVVGVQGIFWDVTARKRAEEELARNAAEFRVARRIQQQLFPTSTPGLAGLDIGSATFGFDIGGASYPAEAIGGDYYDYLPLPDGSLGVAVGDVSGHGLGPALLMAELRAYLRAFAQTETDPAAVLRAVNRLIVQDVEGDRFITLLLARLDARGRRLRYASAGHPTGYLLDPSGAVKEVLKSTGIPLGVFADAEFRCGAETALGPGDLVLLLTDGVAEARAPDGSAFGTERVLDLVRHCRAGSARQIVEELYLAVRAFSQGQPQFDDITATVIKVGPRRDEGVRG